MTVADASDPLQKAIRAALVAAPGLAPLVGTRIYDAVPAGGATKPYLSFGPFDVITEEADEYEGSDTTIQIDAWADGPDSVGVKRVGREVRAALHGASLALDQNQRLVALTVEQIRYLRDPDGITAHGVITIRARTEPTA